MYFTRDSEPQSNAEIAGDDEWYRQNEWRFTNPNIAECPGDYRCECHND